jgi:hypothetical protein
MEGDLTALFTTSSARVCPTVLLNALFPPKIVVLLDLISVFHI